MRIKVSAPTADRGHVNTIAATTSRVPRVALIGAVALVAAFALLMVVRSGVLGSSSSESANTASPTPVASSPSASASRAASAKPKLAASAQTKPALAAKPKLVLLPGLPQPVAHALRFSRVVVVSLYAGPARGDRPAVSQARKGARAAGVGFVPINVIDDRRAASLASFAGPVTAPAMLVVRRPGKIVTRMQGTIDSAVVRQAARNAGARR